MIFYDGTYRLQRREDKRSKASAKEASSWRVRIINFSLSQPDVAHLKPFAVVVTQTGEGIFKANCAESLGKRIFRDFSLDVHSTLWIEHFPQKPPAIYAAVFKPTFYLGPEIFYSIDWRPIRPNELEAVKYFIPEIENVG